MEGSIKNKRIYAYYDGSNFYHFCKGNYGITKIHFHHMTNQLLDLKSEELVKIRYYNSPVNQQEDPEMYAKQLRFFEHLKKTPFLDLSLGRLVKRPLNKINIECENCGIQEADSIQCPGCENQVNVKDIYKNTEKGVDVQLAIDLLLDALNDRYDVALLFSGDADFCPAIRYIIKYLKKEVIFCHFPSPVTEELLQCCSDDILITKEMLEKSQIPPHKQ
ncbi:MAG: NYN domain-containing protein [bacterium]